jgi:hypothetical protein
MISELERFYFSHDEPLRSCLLALREIILQHDNEIMEAWKYGAPFFCFRKKNLCYLLTQKKTREPYIGFVDGRRIEHPKLIDEGRSQVKIFVINPHKDIPVGTITSISRAAIRLCV